MKNFVECNSCGFEVVPNEDGTCYNCSEPMDVRQYLVESKTDSYFVCKSIQDVKQLLNGLEFECGSPDVMGDVAVFVPAWAKEREQYISAKVKYVNQYGSN